MVPRLMIVLVAHSVRELHREIEYYIRLRFSPSSAVLRSNGPFKRPFLVVLVWAINGQARFAVLCVSAVLLLLVRFIKFVAIKGSFREGRPESLLSNRRRDGRIDGGDPWMECRRLSSSTSFFQYHILPGPWQLRLQVLCGAAAMRWSDHGLQNSSEGIHVNVIHVGTLLVGL